MAKPSSAPSVSVAVPVKATPNKATPKATGKRPPQKGAAKGGAKEGGAKGSSKGGKWVFQPFNKPSLKASAKKHAAPNSGNAPARSRASTRSMMQRDGPPRRSHAPARDWSKGKGQSKGQSKGKGKSYAIEAYGPARVRVLPNRITGKVLQWKGKFGWIKPDMPIKQAGPHRNKIYFGQEDVEQELAGVGSGVSFFLYSGEQGLGAEHIIPAKSTPSFKKQKSGSKPAGLTEVKDKKVLKLGKLKFRNRGKKGTGKKDGEGEKKEKGPSGPDLERERVTSEMVTGEVMVWKRTFGWIKPSETIDHPEAEKHGGKIYVHKKDLVDAESVKKGDTVQFYVFADASGLGAEEASIV